MKKIVSYFESVIIRKNKKNSALNEYTLNHYLISDKISVNK